MITELDIVILKVNLPEHHLVAGDSGNIVHVNKKNKSYQVEFIATDGSTIALVELLHSQLRLSSSGKEIFSVREIAS